MENRFFSTDETRLIMVSIRNNLQFSESSDALQSRGWQIALIVQAISLINSRPDFFDKSCGYSIGKMGVKLASISSVNITEKPLDEYFSYFYRIIAEAYISSGGSYDELSSLYTDFYDAYKSHREILTVEAIREIDFAVTHLPVAIVKSALSSDSIKSISEIDSLVEKLKGQQKEWMENIGTRAQKVKEIQDKLERQEVSLNFVGLDRGYSRLRDSKILDKRSAFFGMIFFGALMFFPALFGIYSGARQVDISHLFLGSITLILLYYFRISLMEFRSIKSQLLQIELRNAMCQFVQAYADYAKDINDKSPGTLEKFESIVFSNIYTEEKNIPSIFDGFEKIAKVIKPDK